MKVYRKGIEFECLIDLEDYEKIKDIKWRVNDQLRVICNKNKYGSKFLHRFIMNYSGELSIDHINRNTLDNRKKNLRICKQQDNMCNLSLRKSNKFGVSGISWNKKMKKYEVYLSKSNKKHYLGCYENFEEAVKIRLEAEELYYGEFAPQINRR